MLKRPALVVAVTGAALISTVPARAGLDTPQTLRDAEALRGSRMHVTAPSLKSGRRGLTIVVHYSAKAADALVSRHEGVTVWASWYGDPSAIGRRHADQVGQIDLGHERVTRSGAAVSFVISGDGFLEQRLGWVKGHQIEVNVNVFSARRSAPDNILDCDFYQGPLTAASKAPQSLTCSLLAEKK